MGAMNEPKRHHFIPRLHLQHFAGADPKGHVWTYEKQTGAIRSAIPDETAVESYFYSFKDEQGILNNNVEETLSKIESSAAPIYDMLLNGTIPADPQQRMDFSHFLAVMHVRTPAMRRMVGKMLSQQLQALNYAYGINPDAFEGLSSRVEKETGKVFSNETREAVRQKFIDPSGYEMQISKESTLFILGTADKIAPILQKMKWSVFEARHGFFITSDNPLLRDCDPKTKHPIYGDHGFLNNTNEIVFPLSKSKLLFLCWNPLMPNNRLAEREYVDIVNTCIAARSDRYLYAHLKHKPIEELAKSSKDMRPDMSLQGFGPDKFAPTKVMRRIKP